MIKFDVKQKPVVFNQKDDMTIEAIGKTNMTEGEMRALLEQRKVIKQGYIIRILIGIVSILHSKVLQVKRRMLWVYNLTIIIFLINLV